MKEFFRKIWKFIKDFFLPPRDLNWSYPLFVMTMGLTCIYIIKSNLTGLPFSPTSIVFNALIIPLVVLISLFIPAVSLSSYDRRLSVTGFTGSFRGIGPLILAFFSGVPMSLIYTALHNLSAYLCLRLTHTMVYPAFMCYNLDDSVISKLLEIATQSVIPALGVSLFFTGLLYSLFREENRGIGNIIIIGFYILFSLDPVNSLGLIPIGWWILKLRKKADNVFAPFLALVAMKITEVCFAPILSPVDTTTLLTYSDIPSTVFYSSAPAVFVALILFFFFKTTLDDYEKTYHSDLLGREDEEKTKTVPKAEQPLPFVRGLNPSLIVTIIILAAVWVSLFI